MDQYRDDYYRYLNSPRETLPMSYEGYVEDRLSEREKNLTQMMVDIGRLINLCDGQPDAINAEQVATWLVEILTGEF